MSEPTAIRYARWGDTTWPCIPRDAEVSGPEWVLRYGTVEAREAQRMSVASVLQAYAHLTDPSISTAQAVRSLKRARHAVEADGAAAFIKEEK